jgi:hypothetical protein
MLKNIFKRGYEEIRDRKLLEILKKDRTWLKYELHCNVKTIKSYGSAARLDQAIVIKA